MKLVLVRHCEVIKEYRGRYNGHIEIPLSPKGHSDAKALGEKLKTQHFDAIYCSDLLRCKETLKAFNLDLKTVFTPDLREKSWGKHEGMSFEEIEQSGIRYTNFEEWISQLDGESVEDFTKRIKDFFYTFLKRQKYEKVLIVTHAGVIKTLYALAKKLPLKSAFGVDLHYGEFIEIEL